MESVKLPEMGFPFWSSIELLGRYVTPGLVATFATEPDAKVPNVIVTTVSAALIAIVEGLKTAVEGAVPPTYPAAPRLSTLLAK